MWTKGARSFCNFSSTFLESVEKRFLAYIYICLFLYLPICLLPTIILDLVYLPTFISAIIECLNKLLPYIHSDPSPSPLPKSYIMCMFARTFSKLSKFSRKRSLAFENDSTHSSWKRFWWSRWLCRHNEKNICIQNIHSW